MPSRAFGAQSMGRLTFGSEGKKGKAKCVNIFETGRRGEEVKGRTCKGCDTRVGRKETEKGKETVMFLLMS